MQTDVRTEMMRLIVVFHNFADAPKNYCIQVTCNSIHTLRSNEHQTHTHYKRKQSADILIHPVTADERIATEQSV